MSRLKDKITNHFLSVKNFWLHLLSFDQSFKMPEEYKCVYLDDFTKMKVEAFDEKYIRGQRWGIFHPNDMHQWYDPKAIEINEKGLILKVTDNHLYLNDGRAILRGCGFVESRQAFGYGVYSWRVTLPKGKKLWPAIWVYAKNSWPPEIDVVEAYSDLKGRYGNKMNSNLFLGKDTEKHFQLGAMSHGLLCNENQPIDFILHWEKDFVKIYYNGFLVRKIENKKDLEYLNIDPSVTVLMNTSSNLKNQSPLPLKDQTERPMVVEFFKYFK